MFSEETAFARLPKTLLRLQGAGEPQPTSINLVRDFLRRVSAGWTLGTNNSAFLSSLAAALPQAASRNALRAFTTIKITFSFEAQVVKCWGRGGLLRLFLKNMFLSNLSQVVMEISKLPRGYWVNLFPLFWRRPYIAHEICIKHLFLEYYSWGWGRYNL